MANAQPTYTVTARVSSATSVQEVSKIFAGLHSLDRAGHIRFSIEAEKEASQPRVVRLAALDRAQAGRAIAIDLADQRELFSIADVEEVDVYFKRSFWPAAIAGLPEQLRAKVRPFGLNHPTVSVEAGLQLLSARVRTGRDWRGFARDARQLLALPDPQSFECPPDVAAEPLVLFQTRVWPPVSDDPTVPVLNEERVQLVRALRKAFGRRFLGGIVPSEFACRHFPDVITRLPFSMRSYARLLKRPLVGVYSRGLHESIAFKLSEYLAASRCIVAEMPEGVLPQPLVEGENYLGFAGAEQCVAQCERILSGPTEAGDMRRLNWQYYCSQVEAGAQLLRTIEQAFDDSARG